tara:strand:- start:455 stop:937 length:483 start_codon:yes stop_codon:yes gene_type:complete
VATHFNIDILIPIKAHSLGFKLKNHNNLSAVIEIVEDAINRCGDKKEFAKRKVFYYLLKCEITKETNSLLDNRNTVKKYCEDNNQENLFENYMRIVDYNLPTKKIDYLYNVQERSFNTDVANVYEPLKELFGGHEISEKDASFLYHTTLKEILDKHFGET